LKDGTPTARKVPKGRVPWERVKDKKNPWEKSYEARVVRESEGRVVPEWMKVRKVIFFFPALLIILTVVAFLVETLRYVFPLAGIVVMIVTYFLGGGLSEWHSVSPTTTTSAKSMLEYRYGESASDWDVITIGFIIGGIIFLSGVVAILTDALF
jgi:hypothetical protein